MDDPLDDETEVARPEPSGVDAVDHVVASVVALEGRPLDEQVAGLEQAHTSLRAALDDPGPASGQPGRPGPARGPGG